MSASWNHITLWGRVVGLGIGGNQFIPTRPLGLERRGCDSLYSRLIPWQHLLSIETGHLIVIALSGRLSFCLVVLRVWGFLHFASFSLFLQRLSVLNEFVCYLWEKWRKWNKTLTTLFGLKGLSSCSWIIEYKTSLVSMSCFSVDWIEDYSLISTFNCHLVRNIWFIFDPIQMFLSFPTMEIDD